MSYKALFAIATALDLETEQTDVKIAFLNGQVDHKIYAEQPRTLQTAYREYATLTTPICTRETSPRPVHHIMMTTFILISLAILVFCLRKW